MPSRHTTAIPPPPATPSAANPSVENTSNPSVLTNGTPRAASSPPTMNDWDMLAKDALELLLEDAGTVERQFEVSHDAQYMDVTFSPSPEGRALLRTRGLFGRMAAQRCGWEVFHDAPSLWKLRGVTYKHLGWHDALETRAKKRVPVPTLYVVSAEPVPKLIALPGAALRARWPAGFYDLTFPLLGVCIVVVPELPVARATLPLRLLGRDAVLEGAIAELKALPSDAWERAVARAVVTFVTRRRQQEKHMSARTDYLRKQYDEIMQNARNEGERKGRDEGERKGRDEGERKGRNEGLTVGLKPLAHQFERRLGRALSAQEHATLRARLDTVGPARLGDVVLDLDATALALWLADPAAT